MSYFSPNWLVFIFICAVCYPFLRWQHNKTWREIRDAQNKREHGIMPEDDPANDEFWLQ